MTLQEFYDRIGGDYKATISQAWIPSLWSVGARLSITGCSLMTSSRTSHTSG